MIRAILLLGTAAFLCMVGCSQKPTQEQPHAASSTLPTFEGHSDTSGRPEPIHSREELEQMGNKGIQPDDVAKDSEIDIAIDE